MINLCYIYVSIHNQSSNKITLSIISKENNSVLKNGYTND